ncbi:MULTISPECIES: hypothetical protein [Mesorhizobium]|uniref:hypothetical protein n=1 Tax=Mesorhizobium TaxID=68287 RepID=UPI0007A93CDD|nr:MULTISPECIES: hypothetical protein [Mesorhizobium]AMX93709.1 hypothetical protein A4R28_11655 [Mesorhizobium ciceri]MDF3208408.1 hypothetical protein [Mesorhizobium sp. LMG15046]MDF3229021.1 hypothetical protein [Mesorhizobium sp. DSM 30133]RUU22137.1 hypothetical protein EOC84_03235 [Mesorhizobium sp. Primo-B]RUU37953.1 hypothetical protein EOC83_16980 [Mesorhizobium sp. Primo-A]
MPDISPEDSRDFLRGIITRNKEREDGRSFKVIVHMTREEATKIWAAKRWLDVYREWGVGIEETDFTIDYVRKFLGELIEGLKVQKGAEEMTIMFKRRGLNILTAAELHLDRYVIMRSAPDRSKSWKGKK